MEEEQKNEPAQDGPTHEEAVAGWKRALADYDNLQKKLAEERGRMRRSAAEEMASLLLPVIDNFDQAARHKPEGLDGKAEGWLSGILHVRSQLDGVLADMGLAPFGASGDAFDPNRHEAAGEKADPEQEDGIVLEVVQRGWAMGETLIRPARVIVNNREIQK